MALASLASDDLRTVDRVLGSISSKELARFFAAAALPKRVVLVGGRSLEPALALAGKTVEFTEHIPASVPDDALIIWDGPSFEVAGYETAADLRRRFPGRVTTTFNVLSGASLFYAVGDTLGFHAGDRGKLVDIVTGAAPPTWRDWADRLNEHVPIGGKKIMEFGPLDGGMTSILFQCGAKSVTCVEIRMVNILKMLALRHVLDWGENLKLLVEDMHMVDAASAGRFDLVIAHGVYYHSGAPFRLLRNLASLSDNVFLGGYFADPERLRRPLVTLRDGAHEYRAQPYQDKIDNDGGGAHATAYYFMLEDLIAFMARIGFSSTVLTQTATPENKAAGQYLRLLCRRT